MLSYLCTIILFYSSFKNVLSFDKNNTKFFDNFIYNYKLENFHINEQDDSHYKLWDLFSDYNDIFNKKYESFTELEIRYDIFRENVMEIIRHNMNNISSFKLGINHFTDLTTGEFSRFNKLFTVSNSKYCDSFIYDDNMNVDDEIDWREKGAVTSVKDQGQCGSCWTFSATGAIEGAWAIAEQDLVDLSEQELVDCATGFKYGSHGCNGGQMDGAFQFVMDNGQCSYNSYPYVSGDTKSGESCMKDCTSYAKISKCYDVESNNQLALKHAVFMQPVSVAIEADTFSFQSYSSGVLDTPKCGTKLDHGVLIVGYGEEDGKLYWLVKNSWGESWGDNGYIKIARSESENDPGICGIGMQGSFPTI
jgi:C1A family cysteine protease